MLAIAAFLSTPACNAADVKNAGGVENSGGVESSGGMENRSLADLPRISRRGTEYPYIGYSESTGQTASRGRAFFLHPMMTPRNELLALEYMPGGSVETLFGEDLAGTSGPAVSEGRNVRITFMPLSLPRGVAAGQEWRMRYINREFACRSRAAPGPGAAAGQIAVSCASEPYTLNFTFDRERGVTEYQDFCDHSICTFRLTAPLGLLSRATLEHMGLPSI